MKSALGHSSKMSYDWISLLGQPRAVRRECSYLFVLFLSCLTTRILIAAYNNHQKPIIFYRCVHDSAFNVSDAKDYKSMYLRNIHGCMVRPQVNLAQSDWWWLLRVSGQDLFHQWQSYRCWMWGVICLERYASRVGGEQWEGDSPFAEASCQLGVWPSCLPLLSNGAKQKWSKARRGGHVGGGTGGREPAQGWCSSDFKLPIFYPRIFCLWCLSSTTELPACHKFLGPNDGQSHPFSKYC